MLASARRLFLTHGPDAVALDAVAADAKVSKATFYANFADRSALLEALIGREADRIVGTDAAPRETQATLAETLTAFGVRLLHFLSDPDMVAFDRLVIAAAASHPDLPARFYAAGPGRGLHGLADMIRAGVAGGELDIEAADRAAEDLIGLWQGTMRIEQSMGLHPATDPPALLARAERGVALFFRLYGTVDRSTIR